MSASALLDTSFLISLMDESRPHHGVAEQYFRHMLKNDVLMIFSSIVAAEFGIKQDIADLPLSSFKPVNFTVPHGQTAARFWNVLGSRDEGDARQTVKDDVKLIAQAFHEGIGVVLTEDASSLHRYCERLRHGNHIQTRAITLKEGFDATAFNADGQLGFGFIEPTTEQET